MCDHLRPLDVLSACDYLAVGQDLEDALCFFVVDRLGFTATVYCRYLCITVHYGNCTVQCTDVIPYIYIHVGDETRSYNNLTWRGRGGMPTGWLLRGSAT